MKNKGVPIILGILSILVPYFSVYSLSFAALGILLGIMGLVAIKKLIHSERVMKIGKVVNVIGIICSSLWGLYLMTYI